MFRLSKGSEYAILGLTYMAEKTGPGASPGVSPDISPDISIDEIAQARDIPKAFLAKLFHTLATRRLVRSFRGREGGFVLARPASEITLLQVVEAIEGPIDQGAESEKRGGTQEVSGSNPANTTAAPLVKPRRGESALMKANRGFDVPSAQKPTNVMLKPRRGESEKRGASISQEPPTTNKPCANTRSVRRGESEKRGGTQEVSGSNRKNISTVPSSAPPQVGESALSKGINITQAEIDGNAVIKPLKGDGCDIYSVLRECLGSVSSTLSSYTLRDMAGGAKAAPKDADETNGNAEAADIIAG